MVVGGILWVLEGNLARGTHIEEDRLATIGRFKGVKPDELFHRVWLKLAARDMKSSQFLVKGLERRNQSSKRIVSSGGPVVSLTTYGKRLDSVFLTLESMGRGTLLPSRLILWMDEEDRYAARPDSLRRLEARGLEILLTPNYGPHKKYYPYLESNHIFTEPLITADDDVIYPATWLQRLVESYNTNPSVVSCYRAHVARLEGDQFAPYLSWKGCRSTEPSAWHFATGVSGTLYPPVLQERIKEAGRGFEELCPRADDIWLHLQALRAGFKIKQVKPWEQNYPVLPGTQDMGLVLENVHGSQNDLQIRKSYTAEDISLLRTQS